MRGGAWVLIATGATFAAGYTIRLRGPKHLTTDYDICEALKPLRNYPIEPSHVSIDVECRFLDEFVVDTTVFARNGSSFCSSGRGPDLGCAIRRSCAKLLRGDFVRRPSAAWQSAG